MYFSYKEFYRFCQAGMILAFVFLSLAEMIFLSMVLRKVSSTKRISVLSLVILGAIFTAVTWIVFVAKVSDDDDFSINYGFEQFGYSFGLAIVSSVMSLLIIILLLILLVNGTGSGSRQPRPHFGGNHTPGFVQKPNYVPGGMYPGNEPVGRSRSRSPMKGNAPPYAPYNQMGREDEPRGPIGHQRMSRRDRNEEEIIANPGYLEP